MIQLSDLSLNLLSTVLSKSKVRQLNDYFDEPIFTTSDTGLTYRKVNELDNFGLAKNQRESESNWRKFSANEVALLHIADKLGSFGYGKSNDTKSVIDFITNSFIEVPSRTQNAKSLKISILDAANVLALADTSTFLLVNKDDVIGFVDGIYYEQNIQEILKQDILTISLSVIVAKTQEELATALNKKTKKSEDRIQVPLNSTELGIIKLIQSGEYSRLELSLADGGVEFIKGHTVKTIEKGERSPAQLVKLIQGLQGFSEARLIKDNGQIVALKTTDKYKPRKK